MRALDFGYMDELEAKYGNVKEIYPLPEPGLTRPSMVIKPHSDSEKATTKNAVINNREEL
jgi:anaerobic dimethyl sulfoxide reductase subunit B (iron-sulfur subunit)